MKLRCKFGLPEHGWVQTLISAGDFELDLEVSFVSYPLHGLVFAMEHAVEGGEGEVWIFLEPVSYYFWFIAQKDRLFDFRTEYSRDVTRHSHQRDVVFETTGTKDEILMPFWRAVKNFGSYSYDERS